MIPPDPLITTTHTLTKVIYGKYWSSSQQQQQQDQSTEANSYYLFMPQVTRGAKQWRQRAASDLAGLVPVVVQFHGGGFTGGSATRAPNAQIDSFLQNGVAFASMDYRLVATKYYYGAGDSVCEEEFIHADASGRLTLDRNGSVMSDYSVRVGRQELNTKCSFDAAAGLNDLIGRAGSLGIDPHRIGLLGSSAGGGEIHYLAWVYRGLDRNWQRYTPVAMVYTMAQLDYPVQNMLDRAWGLWADDVGNETRLNQVLEQDESDCAMIVGNPWCTSGYSAETPVCNKSWHTASMARFCGGSGAPKMGNVTLRDLRETQVWPLETEQDRGIARLWYNSENILDFRSRTDVPRTPFFLYVYNRLNGTQGMNVVHAALYARRYAEVATSAGLEHLIYHPDYPRMSPSDKAAEADRIHTNDGTVLNMRHSFDWRGLPEVAKTRVASGQEQTLFFCHAFNITCSVAPPPPPPPSPSPLTAECQAEIRRDCATAAPAACTSCVHAHAGDLMANGCPKGPGAAQACITYCESLGAWS
jgi:hypothetical protein